ncbi:hypothetical protein B0T14DRAFT_343846 [Immersiella caudata]|uniref:Uncharacterized protein n=1 Tax=Immersiella caudata TaxID=314043 RepID=A0AA39W9K3_9PEZI|nr:hypothetical protein B0T14DRAFT_343846 [Immersiella caudata]
MPAAHPSGLPGVSPGTPHRAIGAPSPNVNYADRFAFRYLAFTPTGQIGISRPWPTVPKHRLPGGFIEPLNDLASRDLSLEAAVQIEFMWTTGGRVRLREKPKEASQSGDTSNAPKWAPEPPIATSEEWQFVDNVGVRQITLCYIADFLPETNDPEGVTDEMLKKKEELWLGYMGVDEARKLIAAEGPKTPVGRWIKERDSWFLEMGLDWEANRK